MKNKKIKKVTFFNYLKFKIKWVFKVLWYCINRPFDILMEWM